MEHGGKGAEPLYAELPIHFPDLPVQYRFHIRLFGQPLPLYMEEKCAEQLHIELPIHFPDLPVQYRFHIRLFGQAFAIVHGGKMRGAAPY